MSRRESPSRQNGVGAMASIRGARIAYPAAGFLAIIVARMDRHDVGDRG